MDGSEVKFSSKRKMPVHLGQQAESILLELSDSLEAAEQELEPSYKQRIADFVNASDTWYPSAIDRLKAEENPPGKIRLLQIFVLSEPTAQSMVFGLEFRVAFDVDHGRGMKVDAGTLKILEYGHGEIAFS